MVASQRQSNRQRKIISQHAKNSTGLFQGSPCTEDLQGIESVSVWTFPGKQVCVSPVILGTEMVDRCEIIFTCLKANMKCAGWGKGKYNYLMPISPPFTKKNKRNQNPKTKPKTSKQKYNWKATQTKKRRCFCDFISCLGREKTLKHSSWEVLMKQGCQRQQSVALLIWNPAN